MEATPGRKCSGKLPGLGTELGVGLGGLVGSLSTRGFPVRPWAWLHTQLKQSVGVRWGRDPGPWGDGENRQC